MGQITNNATIYAFNENWVSATGLTPGSSVMMIISDGTTSFNDILWADTSGKVKVYVSAYLQALFTDTNVASTFNTTKSATVKLGSTTYNITLKYGSNITGDGYVDVSPYNTYDGDVRLRWIDRRGTFQAFTFGKGNETYTDEYYGETLGVDMGEYKAERVQGKKAVRQMSIFRKLVNEDLFRGLTQMMQSNHVSINEDGVWIPVNIVPGTRTWTRDDKKLELQDFEAVVIFPEYVTQKH